LKTNSNLNNDLFKDSNNGPVEKNPIEKYIFEFNNGVSGQLIRWT
jgi:hypothetical protein